MSQTKKKKKATGTKEWANRNVNIQKGCDNNCKYCYASAGAQGQYGYVEKGKWNLPTFRMREIERGWKIRTNKNIMFPSTHDITDFNVEEYLIVAKKLLLVPDVKLLIVSKPRFEIIKRLCSELAQWQDRIMFRFTIGSISNSILKYWEPDAPTLAERIKSLKYAYTQGYKTSVSMEPLLDMEPYALVEKLSPYVTEAIWIGKMKFGKARTKINGFDCRAELAKLEQQDWEAFKKYYKDNKVIRWKDSGNVEYEEREVISLIFKSVSFYEKLEEITTFEINKEDVEKLKVEIVQLLIDSPKVIGVMSYPQTNKV